MKKLLSVNTVIIMLLLANIGYCFTLSQQIKECKELAQDAAYSAEESATYASEAADNASEDSNNASDASDYALESMNNSFGFMCGWCP